MMIGGELAMPQAREFNPGETVLELTGLSLASDDPFGTTLGNISLQLRAGEVLGVGGVAGNGQDEIMLALSGERKVASGQIKLNGNPIGHLGPNDRRLLGLLAAPEERLGHAAAPEMSLAENAFLTGRLRQKLSLSGFVRHEATNSFARAIIEDFDVRTPGIATPARSLSGGNLQKFVIGREVLQNPAVLVVNQPTWGVDAAAAASIRAAIRKLAADGAAVLVISQDLDELMEMSDTFAVLAGGHLSVPTDAHGLNVEKIGLMMGGQLQEDAHASA